MDNKRKRQVLSYMLASVLLLSGCGKKADCDIPVRHVHKYVKEVDDGFSIDAYFDSERLEYRDYNWTPEYFEINKKDEDLYKILTKNMLINGEENWNYLFNQMVTNHDYLEFYYYYTTIVPYTVSHGKGRTSVHLRVVPHSGWTEDPEYYHNTGRMRICHHQYYGYQVVLENNKYVLRASEPVDDIREIMSLYPYFKEDCVKIVDKEYEFNYDELSHLRVEDFDDFKEPDLTTDKIYVKKR